MIENLGVAGPHDAIDFTDNDVTSISNFPLSQRLSTLLLARNRVRHIQPNLAESLPNLQTLVLTSNNVAELADLDPLRRLTKLVHLSLLENPVARNEVRKSTFPHRRRICLILAYRIIATGSFGAYLPSASSTFRR
jgi:U2 small nuclear ribonucleoprotein A'